MRSLSLWDPWGTLVARKLKRVETRSKPCSYRGALAIHVAKETEAVEDITINELLLKAGLIDSLFADHDFPKKPADWPLGKIVAVCRVVDCVKTEVIAPTLTKQELAFGNYSDGRYAWLLEDIVALTSPIPCRGMQGLWNLPEEIERAVLAQTETAA